MQTINSIQELKLNLEKNYELSMQIKQIVLENGGSIKNGQKLIEQILKKTDNNS